MLTVDFLSSPRDLFIPAFSPLFRIANSNFTGFLRSFFLTQLFFRFYLCFDAAVLCFRRNFFLFSDALQVYGRGLGCRSAVKALFRPVFDLVITQLRNPGVEPLFVRFFHETDKKTLFFLFPLLRRPKFFQNHRNTGGFSSVFYKIFGEKVSKKGEQKCFFRGPGRFQKKKWGTKKKSRDQKKGGTRFFKVGF